MSNDPWLAVFREQFVKQRETIRQAASQLNDEQFSRRPAPGFNSVATIIRHIGGNLTSRFTDFLVADGEKPDRDRESEFADWPGTRSELMERFDRGFSILLETLDSLTDTDLAATIRIRCQPLTVRVGLTRALDHIAGHVGQIVYIARLVHGDGWQWLSIPPGQSRAFNAEMNSK